MHQGILRIRGSIDLRQFWPLGASDADTMHVAVDAGSFAFARNPSSRFATTHALTGAVVRGRIATPILRAKGTVVIRLQGVDAPELHHQVTLPRDRSRGHSFVGPFRQPGGVSAVRELARGLRALGGPRLDCVVLTRVDKPADAFDAYGRCVGDVFVGASSHALHVNDWLLEHGWALPTFYTSMRPDEIRRAIAVARVARRERRGLWAHYTRAATGFDRERTYAALDRDQPDLADSGPVVLPKLFRRQATWSVSRDAGLFHGGFGAFLAGYGANGGDTFVPTRRFLDGAMNEPALRFATEVRRQRLRVPPEALVFHEADSAVFDQDGHAIDSW
jgi:endonuclease YncB( thermonuclease family)